MSNAERARMQYENYRYCFDNGHKQWVDQAKRAFDFVTNQQWDPLVKARLEADGRPALTFNVIEALVRSMKGVQRALRNDVRFMPVNDATAEQAQLMDTLWLHVQNETDLDFVESEVWEKGLIMQRAYYEARVSYDDSLQGRLDIRSRRSQDIVLDPSADQYDPDNWPQVIDRRFVSYDDLRRLYGKDAVERLPYTAMPDWYDYEDNLAAHQMGRMPYYRDVYDMTDTSKMRAYMLIGRQYFDYKMKDVFIDMSTGDYSEIPEEWDRARVSHVLNSTPGLGTLRRKVKTVRWTVTCEDEVMHDADSPYKHFTIVPFFPTFIDGVTMGAVDQLIDPQQLFNKVTSQELHIINTTANSGWKVKNGSLKNMSHEQLERVGSKAGFVAVLENIDDMEKIQPNATPQGHDRLSFKADQIMQSLSGVSRSGRGFSRDDASGDKVMQDQASQELNFASWLANLHRSKRLLAKRVLSCIQTHYTEERVIQINRGTALVPELKSTTINEQTPEGAVLNDVTQGRYTTTLVPAPSRTTMSESDFKLMLELRQLGIAIPDALLIELCPASNKAQIISMLKGDSNEKQEAIDAAAAREAEAKAGTEEAKAQKEMSAAELNSARAEKFRVEAQTDPDASYERVEQERIAAERDEADRQFALKTAEFHHTKQQDARELAVELTKIDMQREAAKEKAKQPAAKKPAAKK
jgi:hypothetical protein